MKKYSSYLTIIILLLCGCTGNNDKINIGILLPLTGSRSNAGADGRLGVELALEEVKNTNPDIYKKLSIQIEDDESKSTSAVNATKKLIEYNDTKIILGPLASSQALSVIPIANENKVLLLMPTVSSPKVSGAGKTIFRSGILADEQALKAAQYALGQLRLKTFAVLYMEDETGEGYKSTFIQEVNKTGGKILTVESYIPDNSDFRTGLLKIKEANPELIYVPSTSKALAVILRQMKELGVKTRVISNFGIEGNELLELAGDLANGVLYTSISIDESVREQFRNKYKKDINVVSALCYDGLMTIVKAIEVNKSSDPQELSHYLETAPSLPGITGGYSFNEKHDAKRNYIMKRIDKGQFKEIE